MMKKTIRCAVYTRKSHEEGLEQEFNSLDAQREACEAYVKSQMHEGWVLIKKEYNDGGFSGGNMERPAFKELLKDIENGEIDIVVVYKVDRLTRSLMDFSKIIEIFDKHSTSFVSITQQFNTTSSMGRLTLNILLSFAQFEREVTGERIRDKFEATRKKGLWVTGTPPLGYKKGDGHILEIIESEADIIKTIFEKYLEFKSVRKLATYLKDNGILSRSGKILSCGNIYTLLKNKVYIGKIVHEDKIYEGQHSSIIPLDLFNQVQNLIALNARNHKHQVYAKDGSLLTSLLFDDIGNCMTTTSSNSKTKRYRYYISPAIKRPALFKKGEITKIAAGEIEYFVKNELNKILENKELLQENMQKFSLKEQQFVLDSIETFNQDKLFIRNAIRRVDLKINSITINFDIGYIINSLMNYFCNTTENLYQENLITVKSDVKISVMPQKQNKIIIQGGKNYDIKLIQAIVKSFWYNKLGAERRLPKEAINGNNKRLRKLRFLPPEIIESIINGTQDPELTVKKLIEIATKEVR